jgi:solute carrier family 35 protein E1
MLVLTASLLAFAPATGPRALVSRAAVRPLASPLPQLLPHKAEVRVPQIVMQEEAAATEEGSLKETLVTGGFFALWYLFNIGYNIYNKKALNAMAIPWTMALLQLFVGIPYVAALWATGLRKAPKLTTDNIKTLVPVSLGHLGTHIGAVISLGAGAVSFTHIIKASEPVVSAGLSAVMLGAVYSPITYATLLPIVGGVALASLKELSFTWLGFWAAILSNVSSALRAILAKKTMSKGVGENMTEANLYAVLTILATIFLLPVSLLIETPATIMAAINGALAGGATSGYLWTARRAQFGAQFGATRRNSPTPHIPPRSQVSLLAGAFYYLYNEVAFLALGRVNPVTHAVGNTIKRVVIIIASVIAFKTPISTLGVVGSSIAIFGTLLYSLAKNKYG